MGASAIIVYCDAPNYHLRRGEFRLVDRTPQETSEHGRALPHAE